jgi:hypothetical protein
MIGRRAALKVMMLMTGDGLVKPVNAPAGQATPIGVQPGASGILIARKVIVVGDAGGIFLYAPTPGPGNLIASIAAEAGTDQYGNSYPGGILGELQTNEIQFLNSGAVVGQLAPIGSGAAPPLTLLGLPFVSQAGTAANPSVLSTDVWHSMGLLNGWANAAGNVTCQYRLVASPPNSVEVIGVLNAAAATAVTFFTLPPLYRPASQQPIAAGATAGQVAGSVPFVQCDAGGNLTVQHGTLGAADAYLFHGLISLDA